MTRHLSDRFISFPKLVIGAAVIYALGVSFSHAGQSIVTLECHTPRYLIVTLAVCADHDSCLDYAVAYFNEEKSEARYICGSNNFEINAN